MIPKRHDGRTCGTCSLCCKLTEITEPELNKPVDTWCRHCKPGKGCTIYPDRPQVCRGFRCMWIDGPFTDEWYPPKSKMVLVTRGKDRFQVMVDPAYPNAWRRWPYYSQLCHFARGGLRVVIRIGRRFIILAPDGSEIDVSEAAASLNNDGGSSTAAEVK